MFCALVVTRLVLDLLTSGGKIKKFVMLQFVKQPKINFLGKRRIAYLISLVLIVSGMVVFASRGGKNFGIDFTGGALQQFKFTEAVNIEDVRAPLGEMGLGDALVQQFGGDKEFIIRTDKDVSDMLIAKFKEVFGEDSHELVRVEKVGPAIGKDLRGKALMALFWAMVGICIYISIRFEFRFAIAAIVALLHDVLISVGVLSITGRELSLPVIAALLTIVGYSINDTIVIFDRIREDRHIMRKADYKTIINTSINQTLSRTILTSLTTLLVVMALYLLGGEVINDFAFVLMVGVMAGTYSSIFVASPILIDWPGARRK